MSEHRCRVTWDRDGRDFGYESYSRDHVWRFEGGNEVAASSAVSFLGSPGLVDPEEALVAALSSCHMLSFLALAARKRFVMESYDDEAVGVMEENGDGRLAVTRVALRPRIVWGAGKTPTPEQIDHMHHVAHEQCFIANSVKTLVTVEVPE